MEPYTQCLSLEKKKITIKRTCRELAHYWMIWYILRLRKQELQDFLICEINKSNWLWISVSHGKRWLKFELKLFWAMKVSQLWLVTQGVVKTQLYLLCFTIMEIPVNFLSKVSEYWIILNIKEIFNVQTILLLMITYF